jgi:hypothetical protein
MITHCPCDADHQVVIATRLGDTPSCWNWGGTINREGYGTLTHAGRRWQAHRLSYIAFVGPIPDGLVLDHLCRNTVCVRPDHLEPTTDRVNILRGTGMAARNARKTECQAGHPLPERDAVDTVHRQCATCLRTKRLAARSNISPLAPDDPRHGTDNGYKNLYCRCERCRAANTASHLDYMQRRRVWRSGLVAA